ncbi:MAG: YebC/PmpR family DNA-binding transcriptional regulator [Eubacteriales bacterium]|nr:YebC/PmpR family DNA-binding transcriptional regulator [Eubacteriales bacterium]
MSGHSKWANIKHKKERTDSKRGKIFTKIGREIAVAVKEGGADPDANSKLKDVIAKAKSNNMPNDTIERSIKKAAGELGDINFESIVYEGYGPGGVAVIVEALTDNRNRTASDIRHSFDKNGGALGATGCVAWMFERKGVLAIEKTDGVDEDALMLTALEAGALDIDDSDDVLEITTDIASFSAVYEALEKSGYIFLFAEIQMVPENTVELSEDNETSVQKLLDMLDDNDDVQNVYHNAVL